MLHDAPWAFASSPEEDRALDPDHVSEFLAENENAVVAIEATDGTQELIAAAGIFRKPQLKSFHRAKLWGVFVEPAYRDQGLGRAVISTAIDLARSWNGVDFVDLGVSENAPAAQRLYESLGFRAWGREPESLQCEGRRYDEIFMSLRLQLPTVC